MNAQPDATLDEETNPYISCPQWLKRKQGVQNDEPEEMTKIDILNQVQEETPMVDIHASGTDESMTNGNTHTTSGTHKATPIATLQMLPTRQSLGSLLWQEQIPISHWLGTVLIGIVIELHLHELWKLAPLTLMVPDKDTHTHREKWNRCHCPTHECDDEAASIDEIITLRQSWWSVAATNTRS